MIEIDTSPKVHMKVSKLAGWSSSLFGMVLSMVLLVGCQGPKYADVPGLTNPQSTPPATAASAAATNATSWQRDGIDRISVGDNLYIVFADLPTQVQPIEERVREDGTIMLLQNQSFLAAGKVRGELEKEIRKRYVPDYYKSMTVSVTPKVNTQFYYVYGEVKTPDRQIWLARITVLKAIASANGFTDFARKKAIELTRADGRKFTIDGVKAQTESTLDLEVYPGDKIFVPRRTLFW